MGFVDLSMWPASTSSMDGYVLIPIIVLSGSYSQLLTHLTRGTYYDGKKPSSTWKALLIYQCIPQWRENQDLIGQTCPVQIFQSTHCVCVCVHKESVVSDSLWPYGLWPARFLCPWDFPGKNTGVGHRFLLRGSSQPRDWIHVSSIGRRILYHWAT